MVYYKVVMKYNLSEAKANFSKVMEAVEGGETVTLSKRNKPVATLSPMKPSETEARHHTRIGWAKGQVKIKGDLTEPAMRESDWDMLS